MQTTVDSRPEAHIMDTVRSMVAEYATHDTFGYCCEILGGKDPDFVFVDWWRMFRCLPRLRRDLVLGLIYTTFSKRHRHSGFAVPFCPGKKYNFSYRSLADLLIWEGIVDVLDELGMAGAAGEEGLLNRCEECLRLAFRNGRTVAFGGSNVLLFSYFPQRDHRIPEDSPAFRHFASWDANVPDNDSTSLVCGSALNLVRTLGLDPSVHAHDSEQIRLFLLLLREHVYAQGIHGHGALSYRNGVSARHPGILTWIFDEHNELDPSVNVNVLSYLCAAMNAKPTVSRELIAELFGIATGFLRDLADRSILLETRTQLYYPRSVAYFLWYRFLRNYERLGRADREALDLDSSIAALTEYFTRSYEDPLEILSDRHNGFDRVLMGPLLLHTGHMERDVWHKRIVDGGTVRMLHRERFELCHLRYPSTVICCGHMIPFMALLYGHLEAGQL